MPISLPSPALVRLAVSCALCCRCHGRPLRPRLVTRARRSPGQRLHLVDRAERRAVARLPCVPALPRPAHRPSRHGRRHAHDRWPSVLREHRLGVQQGDAVGRRRLRDGLLADQRRPAGEPSRPDPGPDDRRVRPDPRAQLALRPAGPQRQRGRRTHAARRRSRPGTVRRHAPAGDQERTAVQQREAQCAGPDRPHLRAGRRPPGPGHLVRAAHPATSAPARTDDRDRAHHPLPDGPTRAGSAPPLGRRDRHRPQSRRRHLRAPGQVSRVPWSRCEA